MISLFKNYGILGINARNLLYLKAYNTKKAILLADDKLKTKAFLSARGIPVPRLYGSIHSKETLTSFDFNKLPPSFVVKPNLGYGGQGIIPVIQHTPDSFINSHGEKINEKQLRAHIRDILDGRYALNGGKDIAFFEQLIIADERIGRYGYKGLPDVRVVVHNLIPVMAMLRLPTKESNGKANLHQGAIGTGIDIAKGEITHILCKNKIIPEIPGYGPIRGVKIPYWDDILMIASKAQLVTNLGYMAADIAIDKTHGPILLEINARAGLSVQIANLAPLRKRLERIKGLKVSTPEKGIRIAKDVFGHKAEKNMPKFPDKTIVNTEETIELIFKDRTLKIDAFLNTGLEKSLIDKQFAEENALLQNPEDYNAERSTLKIKFGLAGKRLQTIVDISDLSAENYKFIVGRRDLENFLINPISKKKVESTSLIPNSLPNSYWQEIDQELFEIENNLKLLYYLRPLNLEEERLKFFKNFNYNPHFTYTSIKFDPAELQNRLLRLNFDDSPLGTLFKEKCREIEKKIRLLENRGNEKFSLASIELYGEPSSELLEEVQTILGKKITFPDEVEKFTAEIAKDFFTNALRKYGLKNWKVKIKTDLVANCVVGKNNTLLIKKDSKFSEQRLKNLVIHEIETHILTAENGKHQPFAIFNRGFAHYLTTQEGLALYNVQQHGLTSENDRFYLAAIVKATSLALECSFAEIFQQMLSLGLPPEKSFKISLKLKRGFEDTSCKGAFTKDHLYYVGKKQVTQFIQKGGALKDLYYGKFNLDDLTAIKKIPDLKPPHLLPKWLQK